MMKTEETLEKFLRAEFPEEFEDFTLKNKEFLKNYAILKAARPNSVLLNIEEKIKTETAYYKQYPYVEKAKDRLQYLYHRFKSLYRGKKPAECKVPPFENSFVVFLDWWYSKTDENGKRHCYYCGVDEQTSLVAFDKIIFSEKFTGGLQIEKKDPNDGYNNGNCEFACVLCNNAKSDMISSEDFKKYFAPAVTQYWEHIKQKIGE